MTVCAPQLKTYYLGKPGVAWVSVRAPDTGYSGTLDQGRITHALIGGGNAVQRQKRTRRQATLAFSNKTADQSDQLISMVYGLLGTGPYCYVDPTWRNQLPGHIAAAGKLEQTSSGFIPTTGAVAYSSSVAPPTAAPLSGVQAWTAPVNGTLGINQSAAAVPQLDTAVPFVPGLPVTFAPWLKTSANTTITVTAQCSDATGVSTGTVALGTWTVTTAAGWARFAAALAAASVPAGTALISWTLKSSAAATIDLAALDAEYISAAISGSLATALPAWVMGLGVPRMLISGTQPWTQGGRLWLRSHALTLVEVA